MPFKTADVKKHTKKASTAKLRRQWVAVANGALSACQGKGGSLKDCEGGAIRRANGVIAKGVEEMGQDSTATIQTSDNVARFVKEGPEAEEDANLEEGHFSDEVAVWTAATSFADLEAERETRETVQDLRRTTDDLMQMVSNVMWRDEIENKVTALRSLFDEYLVIVREELGDATESEPDVSELSEDDAAIDLAEQADLLSIVEPTIDDLGPFSTLLAEKKVELTDPRRAPVLVNFAIIQPGHGNRKQKNYYPAQTLAEAGPLVAGVDIFVTDHVDSERGEKTKVGQFRTSGILTEDGLVAQALIYDPDQAEKTRNRADGGALETLHCSIYASGKGRPDNIDGQDVTRIESITGFKSIDLVSRHGAGGRAISLAENDGGNTMDPETPQTEIAAEEATETPPDTDVQEVEIVESDVTPEETPPNETPAVEDETPPPVVEAARVAELLAETDLDEKAQAWVLKSVYQTEDEVQQAIAEMRAFIADLTPAGQPFGLGDTVAVVTSDVPKLLTVEELEERARQNTRDVITGIDPTYAGNL